MKMKQHLKKGFKCLACDVQLYEIFKLVYQKYDIE